MRIIYTSQHNKAGPGQIWSAMIKLAMLMSAATALLAITLIGLFIVLPIMLVGGIALSFYLRRRLRQAQRRQPKDGVIDAEYTVVERR
ncbi:hypothetical protein DC522_24425 [Microvirga sp. KLBC 81]|uniref:hypothetical protein n=1 Tax=Microvirga sp. KLBC 81 TaxID=1862707 RepID=UPI000D50F769|nr:hypothetical protein [Microvirga sp. KLBC 81]PVE21861.1 hypothetical protein DC522_24425 [Microvirga sp. KLBC 81]